MSWPIYYVIEDDTLVIPFATYEGVSGQPVTITGLAVGDIEIYKDTSMTQRASDSGFALVDTDGIDIDSRTGIHAFSIDLSDNADAGFYAVGPWYTVIVDGISVDGVTMRFIAAQFRILDATRGMAGTALPDAAADAAGGLPISDAGGLDLDAMNTNINDIEADTNELQTDDVPGLIAALNDPTVAQIADGVWDEAKAGHVGAGSFGEEVQAHALSSELPSEPPTAAQNADAVWDEAQADHVGAGSFGEMATEIAAIEEDTSTTLQAELDGIQADTEDIQSRLPAALSGAGNMKADLEEIQESTVHVDKLAGLMTGVYKGAVNDASASTTQFIVDGFTEATDDHLIGRLLTFTSGALIGQQTDILDWDGGTQTITVSALTEAPADNVEFVIH